MGSRGSKGKKVAPATVFETNVYRTDKTRRKDSQLSCSLTLQRAISKISLQHKRIHPDCDPEDRDSEFSVSDEDNIDETVDRILAECETGEYVTNKKSSHSKVLLRSDTYGLSNSKLIQNENQIKSNKLNVMKTYEHTRGRDTVCINGINDKRVNPVWNAETRRPTSSQQKQNSGDRPPVDPKGTEPASIPGRSEDQFHVGMPVILYDDTEEDLMNMIEREFS